MKNIKFISRVSKFSTRSDEVVQCSDKLQKIKELQLRLLLKFMTIQKKIKQVWFVWKDWQKKASSL